MNKVSSFIKRKNNYVEKKLRDYIWGSFYDEFTTMKGCNRQFKSLRFYVKSNKVDKNFNLYFQHYEFFPQRTFWITKKLFKDKKTEWY